MRINGRQATNLALVVNDIIEFVNGEIPIDVTEVQGRTTTWLEVRYPHPHQQQGYYRIPASGGFDKRHLPGIPMAPEGA
jgi:hypothetical protein